MPSATSLCALAFACALASAQGPSLWSSQPIAAGSSPQVLALGKLVHFVDQGTLRCWSAATRAWQQIPVSPAATVLQTNDVLVVRDGPILTAVSSICGVTAPLVVTAGAQVVNLPSRTNDSIVLVRDGLTLHAFSGFTGRWVSRAVSAAAMTDVQRHVALLADGATVGGFDPFSGDWVDLTAPSAPLQLSADGVCGLVQCLGHTLGFSALHGAWAQAPSLPGAALHRNDDWAVLADGASALAYSGLSHSFSAIVTGPAQVAASEDLFCMLTSPGLLHAYSAPTGQWSVAAWTGNELLRTTAAAASVEDGAQWIAWSALTGAFVSLPFVPAGLALAGAVMAAEENGTGRPMLFSAMTGAFHAPPVSAQAGVPQVSTCGALVREAGGVLAFSARTGAFVPLAGAGLSLESNASSAPLLCWDAGALHFFDARRDVWLHEPRASTQPPNVQIWRTAAFVVDGQDAVGFGSQSGRVERTALPGPLVSFRANSESAALVTAGSVLAMSAVGEALPDAQYPDFRRAQGLGAPLRVRVQMPPGSLALLGLAPLASQGVSLPGLGELLLDPNALFVALLAPAAGQGVAVFAAATPADPALRGLGLGAQALVAPPAATPYLTAAAALWLL